MFAVWEFGEDGLVARAWIFNDRESAERKAGLDG